MKLYATVTSERASKGQGGNDYLVINITNEHKNLLAYIHVTPRTDDIPAIFFKAVMHHAYLTTSREEFDAIERIEKGKKQKDEKTPMTIVMENGKPKAKPFLDALMDL